MEQVQGIRNLAGVYAANGRYAEARDMLLRCKEICEQHGDIRRLAGVVGTLAIIEHELGHDSRAIEMSEDALRFDYVVADLTRIIAGHHDLASLYDVVEQASHRVRAHRLAAALAAFRIGHRTLDTRVRTLAEFEFSYGLPGQPSFEDICQVVEEVDGVRFRELLDSFPQRAPDEIRSLMDLMAVQTQDVMNEWSPLITAVVNAAKTAAETEELQAMLARLDENEAPLVNALRRVIAGERGPELLDDVTWTSFGVLRAVLDTLSEQERAGS
jgi:hypothetical protein